MLAIQALETARCFEEGVLTDVREADVGSILGFGFAPFTGGTLSYIDMMGVKTFVALCERLEKKHGSRFKPNALLLDLAAKDETFYGRFASGGKKKRPLKRAGGFTSSTPSQSAYMASSICFGSRAKQSRMKCSPPAPKAVPGARPACASSTSRARQCRHIGFAVHRKEQIESAHRNSEAAASGTAENVCRRCRGFARRARSGRCDEVLALLQRDDTGALHELRDTRCRILNEIFDHLPERRMRGDPAHAPAGHRPVLRERIDEENAIIRRHHIEEGWCARPLAIPEPRIDFVGDDPESCACAQARAADVKFVVRRGPAGWIGRRDDR